ncbi:serine hydrolase [uncultured Maricaulis sp.]|uniref:serine hydrolase domain-containing protein n=1 Tax=uncultured Maricaulis sp. TaxID=174710 RepID=UPI00261B2B00|nr:serine hydrolase domain-containing protein [uncultured Maricaulis sp.]
MTHHRAWLGATTALALLTVASLPHADARQAAPATVSADADQPQLDGLADFIDGVMAQQIRSHEIAGATVAVVHDGELLFSAGYGFADIENGSRVDPARTLFRPGSVSKLFTWTALMQQVEEGHVDLDEDVNAYIDFHIPDFEGQPVRVRDLLSHTPGMSDVSGITAATVDELVDYGEWIQQHIPERVWAPGTEIAYSNYGVALAGYIVERLSGEAFADYANTHIFEPLDMHATSFREPLPAHLAAHMATGYEIEDGLLTAQPFELFSLIMPAGSASATAHDMSRFMRAMLNGGALGDVRILGTGSVELLMSNSIRNAPDLPGMAHGFYVVQEDGPRLIGHGGNTGDFHSNLILAPRENFGFFVSTTGGSESSVGRTDLTNAIIGRVFPQAPTPREPRAEGEVLPTGAYRMNRRNYAQPAREEYDIEVTGAGENAIRIRFLDDVSYWERIGPMTFEKVTGAGEDGPFDRVQFYPGRSGLVLSFSYQPYMAYHRVTD